MKNSIYDFISLYLQFIAILRIFTFSSPNFFYEMLRINTFINVSICQKATSRIAGSFFRELPRIFFFFFNIRESSLPMNSAELRGRNVGKKHAITNVGERNCTRLHPSQIHFVRVGNVSRRDHEEARLVASGNDIRRTEANFRPRFIRRRMDGARFPEVGTLDFRGEGWLSADGDNGGGGGGRVAAPWKMPPRARLPPGEVHSSSTSLFPLSTGRRDIRGLFTKVQFGTAFVNWITAVAVLSDVRKLIRVILSKCKSRAVAWRKFHLENSSHSLSAFLN